MNLSKGAEHYSCGSQDIIESRVYYCKIYKIIYIVLYIYIFVSGLGVRQSIAQAQGPEAILLAHNWKTCGGRTV